LSESGWWSTVGDRLGVGAEAAQSAGLTGHRHVSSADTIAQIERFLGTEP